MLSATKLFAPVEKELIGDDYAAAVLGINKTALPTTSVAGHKRTRSSSSTHDPKDIAHTEPPSLESHREEFLAYLFELHRGGFMEFLAAGKKRRSVVPVVSGDLSKITTEHLSAATSTEASIQCKTTPTALQVQPAEVVLTTTQLRWKKIRAIEANSNWPPHRIYAAVESYLNSNNVSDDLTQFLKMDGGVEYLHQLCGQHERICPCWIHSKSLIDPSPSCSKCCNSKSTRVSVLIFQSQVALGTSSPVDLQEEQKRVLLKLY
jgi:hypothetical protein